MKTNTSHIEAFRFTKPTGDKVVDQWLSDKSLGMNGVFYVPSKLRLNGQQLQFKVIVSNEGGWDHVSVSLPHRTPTWEEMCFIKDLFFKDAEVAIQYHPAKAEYVNNHPHCLHLWRNQLQDAVMPPTDFV